MTQGPEAATVAPPAAQAPVKGGPGRRRSPGARQVSAPQDEPQARRSCMRPDQPAPAAAPPGERAWTEPAADLAGPTGQAGDAQPGPHAGRIGELSPSSGPSQRGQHCQARCERGGHHHCGAHRPGLQPQQAQAQAHQWQHRQAGTATRRRDAAPARFTHGPPSGGAHGARDEAPAIPGPLPCLTLPGTGVPAIRWAKTRPGGLNGDRVPGGPARSAHGPLPPPAAVHPATRTAIAPSNAPARRDRGRACQAVIASSRHGSSATPLTHRRRDRFPPGVRSRPASLA